MPTTQQLARKADLVVGDLQANGGYLPPVSAARFIRLAIDDSVLLPMSRVIPLRSPVQYVPKLRFTNRILHAASEGTPVAVDDRAKPDTSQVEMSTKKAMAEVDLTEEVLEDNIEGDAFRDTITALMAERISLDIDDMIANSDLTSTNPDFAFFDGIRVAATSNVVNVGGDTLHKGILRDTFKAMPTEYRKRRNELRFLTSSNAVVDYTDSIANRMTTMGDAALREESMPTWGNIPVMEVPVFPEDLGVGNDETELLLLNPNNIMFGWWRRIRIRTELLTRSGVYVIVASMRFDLKYEHEPAVVKADGIQIAA